VTTSPQEIPSDVLEHDPPAANPPVVAVSPWQRLLDTEPVRLYLWPVLVVLLGLLTTAGMLTDVAPALLAAGEALAAVGGWLTIEGVRASVVSPRRHLQTVVDVAKAAGVGVLR
jgi:hypothetical protein